MGNFKLIEGREPAEAIAQAFVAARQAGNALTDYPGELPGTLEEAYGIQERAIALFGDRIAGWKVGKIPAPLDATYGTNRLTGPIFADSVVTAANGIPQRVPARTFTATHALSVAPGNVLGMASVVEWLELNGFQRASTVRESGEYAVRGGILDLFPPGLDLPVRFDYFGDSVESIKTFDPQTQRSELSMSKLDLVPVAEFQLITETIRRFRTGYVSQFGAAGPDDLLYEAVSEGRRYPGMEHWLPLFHDGMDTLFDYLPDTPVALEALADDAIEQRFAQIEDYYEARAEALKEGVTPAYKPMPPDKLYLGDAEWKERLGELAVAKLNPFDVPPAPLTPDATGHPGPRPLP